MSRGFEDGQERNAGADQAREEAQEEIDTLKSELHDTKVKLEYATEVLIESTVRKAEQHLRRV